MIKKIIKTIYIGFLFCLLAVGIIVGSCFVIALIKPEIFDNPQKERKFVPIENASVSEKNMETKIYKVSTFIGSHVNNIPGMPGSGIRGSKFPINVLKIKNDIKGNPGTYQWLYSASSFKSLILSTYPKNWIDGEISDIYQRKKRVPYDKKTDIAANCNTDSTGYSVITFHGVSLYMYPFEIISEHFSHESAHANDWYTDNGLTLEQRLDFFLKIANRLQSDDRYNSEYLETVRQDYASDHDLQWKKMTAEYWAEICEEYLNGQLQKLQRPDIEIIEWVISLNDPNYDLLGSCEERLRCLGGYEPMISDRATSPSLK